METIEPIETMIVSQNSELEEFLKFTKKLMVVTAIYGTVYALAPLGLLINLSFLYVIARVKSMRTIVNVYLANLAVADMLALVYYMYLVTSNFDVKTEAAGSWNLVCHIASSCFVTALAFQRCSAVRRPLTFRANSSKARALKESALLWVSAIVIGFLCGWAAAPNVSGLSWALVSLALVLCFFVTVLIMDLTLLLHIYWKLRQQRPLPSAEHPHRLACRVARMLIVNTAVFFTLNMLEIVKFALIIIVNTSARRALKWNTWTEDDDALFYLGTVAIVLQLLNCSIDPIVYSATNKDYRKAVVQAFPFLKFLRCCRRRRAGPSPPVEQMEMQEVRPREPNRE